MRQRVLVCLLLAAVSAVAATPKTMRAVVATGSSKKEGDFSNVEVMADHAVPHPRRGQVLIRVIASSVNPVDWKLLTNPFGPLLAMARNKVLGFDVAGVIEEVGEGCSRLKIGDAVWADLGKSSILNPVQLGAYAEYAIADESQVGLKPSGLDFAVAASLPLVALTDLQALRKAGAPWKDRRNFTVVVTSGSGGTGMPAIQMAKAYGASRVVTAASASNANLLKSFGATDVVDYHTSSLWNFLGEDSVDIVYDNFGAPGTADAAMPALRSGGVFVFLPGKNGTVSKHPKQGVSQINFGLCDSSHHEDLDALKDLVDAGQLTGHVQQSFKLEDVKKAFNVSIAGHVIGKLGITVSESQVQPRTAFDQCKSASYSFCCEVGTPCDCTKGTTSPGQCKEESYAFCCSVGTPCDCTKPPLYGANSTPVLV